MKELFAQGGSGSSGIKTNKQAIARLYSVKPSEVTYFAVGGALAGFKVLYDKVTQRTYSLPSGIGVGVTMVSLVNGVLTHSQGTSDLANLAVFREEWVKRQEKFADGFTLNEANEVVSNGIGLYRWAGTFPKTVPENGTVIGTGGEGKTAWIRIDVYGSKEYTDSQIAREVIYLDDIVSSTDGSTDCSPQINDALIKYSGHGIVIKGTKGKTYRIDSTVVADNRVSEITIDFNSATLLDNVQGKIANNANRPNHTFQLYGSRDVVVTNFIYDIAPTRQLPSANEPPPCLFWVGGQYLGTELTKNVRISRVSNVVNKGMPGFIVTGMGELDGIRVTECDIDGGGWQYGANFEYGLRPADPTVDPTMSNGLHPYNIWVEQFNAKNLPDCKGWLRTASCYNATFYDCTTYNVKSAIYGYCGDRNISRFQQNVTFKNIKVKFSDDVTYANASATVLVPNMDGSTGEVLPSWTNLEHMFRFEDCDIQSTKVFGSSCYRIVGNQGKVIICGGKISHTFWGVWGEPSSNPTYVSDGALKVFGVNFKDCFQFVRISALRGVTISDNTFRLHRQGSTSDTKQDPIIFFNGAEVIFENNFCDVFGAPTQATAVLHMQGGVYKIYKNKFIMASSTHTPLKWTDTKPTIYGAGNDGNYTYLAPIGVGDPIVQGEPNPARSLDSVTGNTIDYSNGTTYTSSSAKTLTGITGGKPGQRITFRGIAGASAVTFDASGTGETRIVPISAASETKTGNNWSKTFEKLGGTQGWWEVM